MIEYKNILKNVLFNLLGYIIPLLFAIILIPLIIKNLGIERFGILNIVWILIGYFSFFDFGFGRALTKIISEKVSSRNYNEIPDFFWTSFFFVLLVSIIIAVIIYFLIPIFVFSFFKISAEYHQETLKTFYLLTFSIPVVATTSCMRGLLEAYHRFDLTNFIRIGFGISTFLIPTIVFFFGNSLVLIAVLLLFSRGIVWIIYLILCFKLNPEIKMRLKFNKNVIKSILRFSTWMMLSNIVIPVITYLDRFLIGGLISAESLTYYSTPYEVVTKLTIFSGAIANVMFPTFSGSFLLDPLYTFRLSVRTIKYIFIILFPIIFLIINFSREILFIWLGENFSVISTHVLQLLSLGVLFNSLAYIPFSYIEGIGKPDITAKVQFYEMPLYILLLYIFIKFWGINGAAVIYAMRMLIDLFILFYMMRKLTAKKIDIKDKIKNYITGFLIVIILSLFPLIIVSNIILKFIISISFVISLYVFFWISALDNEEKELIANKVRKLFYNK